jgi:alkylation response protein AidB-like acyl-CoA dehydrogenase
MNFELDEQELILLDKIKTLISEGGLLVPEAIEDAPPKEVEAALRPCLKRLAETGYLSTAVGHAKKGELVSLLAAHKELARSSQVLLFATELGRMVCGWIADHGNESQQQRLAPITSGDHIAAVAVSESVAIRTEAAKSGDEYILNGDKTQVSLAPMADLFAVCARTDQGLAVFLVPQSAAGLEVGPRIRTLGYDALCTSPLRFNDVHIPADNMIGPLSEEDLVGDLRAAEDRAMIAASLGIMGLCLEEATHYANTPKEAGAKPPAGYQIVRFTLAEMLTLTQTAEILANRAIAAIAENDREAGSLLLCAKVFATESACTVSQQALQIMASSGYQRPNPVERAFRNARLGPIVGHTSEVARMSIADHILA